MPIEQSLHPQTRKENTQSIEHAWVGVVTGNRSQQNLIRHVKRRGEEALQTDPLVQIDHNQVGPIRVLPSTHCKPQLTRHASNGQRRIATTTERVSRDLSANHHSGEHIREASRLLKNHHSRTQELMQKVMAVKQAPIGAQEQTRAGRRKTGRHLSRETSTQRQKRNQKITQANTMLGEQDDWQTDTVGHGGFGNREVTHEVRVAPPPSCFLNTHDISRNLLQDQLVGLVTAQESQKRHSQHRTERVQPIQQSEIRVTKRNLADGSLSHTTAGSTARTPP